MMEAADVSFTEHSNKVIWANPSVKGSANKVNKVITEIKKNEEYVELFKTSAFGRWLDFPPQCGDPLLSHGLMLHEIKPTRKTDVQLLYFRLGDHLLTYGASEFCRITGFHFGRYPTKKKEFKKRKSTYRERLFPNVEKDNLLTMNHLECLIFSPRFLEISAEDAVRSCLLYILCQDFFGKDGGDKVTVEWLGLVEELDEWNSFKWGSFLWDHSYKHLSKIFKKIEDHIVAIRQNPDKELKCAISGFSLPFKIWIWEMFPYMNKKFCMRLNRDLPRLKRWEHVKTMRWDEVQEVFNVAEVGRAPRAKMEVTDEEALSDYYLSYTRFASPDVSPVAHDIQSNHRNQPVPSPTHSGSSRSRPSFSAGGPPLKGDVPVWEDHENRICRLEQLVKTENRPATNVNSSFFEGMSNLGSSGWGGHNENRGSPQASRDSVRTTVKGKSTRGAESPFPQGVSVKRLKPQSQEMVMRVARRLLRRYLNGRPVRDYETSQRYFKVLIQR